MTLPTFLVIGALKAATTTVADLLRAHPQVFVPERKELCFFVEEYQWGRGLDWYESCFEGAAGAAALGEASPQYAWWPSFAGVPERAGTVVPDARIVYLVRDPLVRMRSMYLQARRFGGERRSFERVLLEVPDYLETSCYATQLERWLAWFPRDRVHVATVESLAGDPAGVFAELCRFLGVRPHPDGLHPGQRSNVSPPPVGVDLTLSPAVGRHVRRVLGPEAERLAAFLPPGWAGWGLAG